MDLFNPPLCSAMLAVTIEAGDFVKCLKMDSWLAAVFRADQPHWEINVTFRS